jgi:L-alanine-DL-glutamate epimerase-like enolase superfamily enzyme
VLLHLENGAITVPAGPGLGLPLDEAALEQYHA